MDGGSLLRSDQTLVREVSVYRSAGRLWPVNLSCAVVRRKSASLRLVSMRSDTILSQ
jgi:hypothetical protein